MRHGGAEVQQNHGHERGDDHEQRVENIHAGDGARDVGRVAARLDQGKQRHHIETAEHADHGAIKQYVPAAVLRQKAFYAHGLRVDVRRRGKIQIGAEDAQADGAERHQADFDLVTRKFFTQERTGADAHGKDRQQQYEYIMVAVQVSLGKFRELREHDGAIEPEPGVAQQREEHRAVFAGKAQIAKGFGEDVPVDLEIGIGRRRWWYELAGTPADHGESKRATGHQFRAPARQFNQHHAQHFTQHNADERTRLDHGIAADEFILFEMLRQIGIFDRAEHGGMDAHADDGGNQQPQIMRVPSHASHQHDDDFQYLDRPRHARLVELVGQLTRGGGEKHERQNEQAGDHVVQGAGRDGGPACCVKGESGDQCRLEHIIVERPKKLGPEERTVTALLEQTELAGLAHGGGL